MKDINITWHEEEWFCYMVTYEDTEEVMCEAHYVIARNRKEALLTTVQLYDGFDKGNLSIHSTARAKRQDYTEPEVSLKSFIKSKVTINQLREYLGVMVKEVGKIKSQEKLINT